MSKRTDSYDVPRVSLRMVREGTMLATRDIIKSPAKVYDMLRGRLEDRDREVLAVVHVSARNEVLSVEEVAIGSLSKMHVSNREIFKSAIVSNAAAIVIAHNHPSGDPMPSPEDVELTRSVAAAGELMDIELLDHLIIGHGRFVSLRERGLGFN